MNARSVRKDRVRGDMQSHAHRTVRLRNRVSIEMTMGYGGGCDRKNGQCKNGDECSTSQKGSHANKPVIVLRVS